MNVWWVVIPVRRNKMSQAIRWGLGEDLVDIFESYYYYPDRLYDGHCTPQAHCSSVGLEGSGPLRDAA